MPKAIVSDAQFIELWRVHQSAKLVANAIGCTVRAVAARRRAIEKRLDVEMRAADPRTGDWYKYQAPPEHAARRSLELNDGVALVFSDAHFWPGVRTSAYRALVWFAREFKPAVIVNNGDAFDGASISRFPRIGWDSKPTILEELRACKERLGELEEAAGGATLVWPLGNHDARFENRLAQHAPEFEGVKGFSLKDHFPAWQPCWSMWINDDVVIKHRMRGGVHATRNNTLNAGKTIVTGHLHSLKVTPLDDYRGTRWGVDTGTLADPGGPQFIDYLEDNPTDWRSGFVVLTFAKGRLLWPEVVRVAEPGVVDFRGQLHRVPE